jgi:hypothetical protein
MGVKVEWDDRERRTIRYILAHDWTWAEVHEAIATSNDWLDDAPRKVPFIIDLRKSSEKVAEKSLGNVRRVLTNAHPNTGIVVIVGRSHSVVMELAKSIIAMALRISGKRLTFHFAESLEDAREIIRNEIDFA